ncbi:MAG: DedA family protein [Terriglobales bacterium]
MLSWISHHIIVVISTLGYGGVVLLMTLESACIPIPSEIILTFSGFLVATGRFQLVWVAVFGAVGNSIGSMIGYAIGYYGGRPLAHRYGRWLLIAPADLDGAEAWFRRRGDITVLVCRVLPVIRTYIALPAGVVRMPLWRFHTYTFIGSLAWCFLLSYIGYRMGENWNALAPYFHKFDVIWVPLIAALVGIAIWHHAKRFRRKSHSNSVKVSKG